MNQFEMQKFQHVCPRNCPSSCTMISHIENNQLIHISGNLAHPYTKGKLCAKGFSYLEKNYHQERLKYPYYQEVKGSGKFKQITWEKAFDLIIREMMNIYQRNESFLPLALYKGSGNIGVHHFVTEEFFSSLGPTTRLVNYPFPSIDFEVLQYDLGDFEMSDPSTIKEASLVIIWGSNPAATNIHLIPILIEAKIKGAKIVVIDPLYTQTAELADLYIQLSPGTDGALANILTKSLLENNSFDNEFLKEYTFGFDKFHEIIRKIDTSEYLEKCDVTNEAFNMLVEWLKDKRTVSHIIGSGLQKHSNTRQNIRSIGALAIVHGDIGKVGGGIFLRKNNSSIFNNQDFRQCNNGNRIFHLDQNMDSFAPNVKLPIEMLWISCANPITQESNSNSFFQFLRDIPFVVTVDQFLTPTAQMSNLVLPTTTHFEEMDIVMSCWHNEVALNEKAIPPYYESRSEWNIMNELAIRLNKFSSVVCSFPIHSSEEEYLNAQFNDPVFKRYYIKSVSDLRKKSMTANLPKIAWEDKKFYTETGKYQFYSLEAEKKGVLPMPLFIDGKSPTIDYPFWLITPHHPYALNSQFHFLNLTDEEEGYVGINSKVANLLGIFDGEIIKVFNNHDYLEIKAKYISKIPKDILLIYQRWYKNSKVNVNKLSGSNSFELYDTFVNVSKI
ncbi:molybdopterin-dependent oxidoreductase [Bacillus massiliigorillae]|uniref:molybdopterin-dependent oxidoreductase n=1 Tax=Bacillus massiliigorillae TaxID=1243664 RepID=UPI00039ED2A4|nr:molybdopterin-dependent oxidoreductase [Bacillus massiliigorillae]